MWELRRGPRLDRVAALDTERVVAIGDGAVYRPKNGRWQVVDIGNKKAADVAAVDGWLWLRIGRKTLRSKDGQTFAPAVFAGKWPGPDADAAPPTGCAEPPKGFRPAVQAPVGGGRVMALMQGGAAAVCPLPRHELVERWYEGGIRGWFEEPLPPGWVVASGDRLPRDPLAVLPTDPPLAVGREGQLTAVSCEQGYCVAEALVDEPYPRMIDLVPLADGALLAVLEGWLVRIADRRGQVVELDAEGRKWLADAARPGVWSSRQVYGTSLGGGKAVLVTTGQNRALWVDGVEARGFPLTAEPLGAARAGPGQAVILLNHGWVLRGSPGSWRELGHLGTIEPAGVSHAFGVFRGADDKVRLLDPRRPVVCATGTGLEPCGEVVSIREREVFQLEDGLVVETQQITTTLVGADRIEDRSVQPGGSQLDYAGSLGRLLALTHSRIGGEHQSPPEDRYRVRRLHEDQWVEVADVPDGCVPQALAANDGGEVFVACEGGRVLRREDRVEGP